MFAIAVWDAERRELSLVRDRLGKKPLYVYSEPGLVTFGSELKALVAGPSFDRSIDQRRARGLSPVSVRAGAAEHLRQRDQGAGRARADPVRRRSARCPRPGPTGRCADAARDGLAHPFRGTDAEAVDELEALLADADALPDAVSDVPLGALLSGGIDSSTVVALMQEASARPVKTYTDRFRRAGLRREPARGPSGGAPRHRPHAS